jgi:hypothetical protein
MNRAVCERIKSLNALRCSVTGLVLTGSIVYLFKRTLNFKVLG